MSFTKQSMGKEVRELCFALKEECERRKISAIIVVCGIIKKEGGDVLHKV